jgi:hypothetical protein
MRQALLARDECGAGSIRAFSHTIPKIASYSKDASRLIVAGVLKAAP